MDNIIDSNNITCIYSLVNDLDNQREILLNRKIVSIYYSEWFRMSGKFQFNFGVSCCMTLYSFHQMHYYALFIFDVASESIEIDSKGLGIHY